MFSDGYNSSEKEDSSDDGSTPGVDWDNIVLCKIHTAGNMTNDCSQCAATLKSVKDLHFNVITINQ